jgi:hypothetical protein
MRTLLIVVAMLALLLMPPAWVIRKQQNARVAQERALQAEAVAQRERYRAAIAVAQQQFNRISVAKPLQEHVPDKGDVDLDQGKADSIEQLRRENARLKAQVDAVQSSRPCVRTPTREVSTPFSIRRLFQFQTEPRSE